MTKRRLPTVPEATRVIEPLAVIGKVRVSLVVPTRLTDPEPLTGKVSVSGAEAEKVIEPKAVTGNLREATVADPVRLIEPLPL